MFLVAQGGDLVTQDFYLLLVLLILSLVLHHFVVNPVSLRSKPLDLTMGLL